MVWFRRRITAQRQSETQRQSAAGDPQFWINHGFAEGDRVNCAVCGKGLVVRLIKFTPVVIATPDALVGVAMICGDCGRLFCRDCAARRDSHWPSCDRCDRVGGVTGLMKK